MSVAAQERLTEPGWVVIDNSGSPSGTSPLGFSPSGPAGEDFDQDQSIASYASTDCASPASSSTWSDAHRGWGSTTVRGGPRPSQQENVQPSIHQTGAQFLNPTSSFASGAHSPSWMAQPPQVMPMFLLQGIQQQTDMTTGGPNFALNAWTNISEAPSSLIAQAHGQATPIPLAHHSSSTFGSAFNVPNGSGDIWNSMSTSAIPALAQSALQSNSFWPDLCLDPINDPPISYETELYHQVGTMIGPTHMTGDHFSGHISLAGHPVNAAASSNYVNSPFRDSLLSSGNNVQSGSQTYFDRTGPVQTGSHSHINQHDIPLRGTSSAAAPTPVVAAAIHPVNTNIMKDVSPTSEPQMPGPSQENRAAVIFEEVLTPRDKGKTQRRPAERQSQSKVSKRNGGRALGTHLDEKTLEHTNHLRKIGACWICRFQRDKCQDIGGDVCGPCARRHASPHFQTEHSIGCDRTNIVTFKDDLLPNLMTAHFQQRALQEFTTNHIGSYYTNRIIRLQLICSPELPALEVETYEFHAKTQEVLQQPLYYRNAEERWTMDMKYAPPLYMTRTPREEEYDKYVDNVTDNYLPRFAAGCFEHVTNDFQNRLLQILCNFKPADDHKELRQVFRFFVTRLMLNRLWWIPDDTRDKTLSTMNSYRPGAYAKYCSPRMTNKQVKSCFNGLHSSLLQKTLSSYQHTLRESGLKWVTGFIMIVVLAMVTEECQKMMHATAASNAAMGLYTPEDGERQAIYLAQNQDERWYYLMCLFRAKFTLRGYNPFKSAGAKKFKDKLTEDELRLVDDINNLMQERSEYLHGQQHVPIATKNQGEYTGRLVARFLLHFWSDPN